MTAKSVHVPTFGICDTLPYMVISNREDFKSGGLSWAIQKGSTSGYVMWKKRSEENGDLRLLRCWLKGGGRGQRPRKASGPQKLEKARKQTLPQRIQKARSPANTLTLGLRTSRIRSICVVSSHCHAAKLSQQRQKTNTETPVSKIFQDNGGSGDGHQGRKED